MSAESLLGRQAHLFQFEASKIAEAARAEADYHRGREAWWRSEYLTAAQRVKATATIEVRTYRVTGGERADVVLNYGDPAAYKRMGEAWQKVAEHCDAAGRYASDAQVYGTQAARSYELTLEDVHYFRFGGEARPE